MSTKIIYDAISFCLSLNYYFRNTEIKLKLFIQELSVIIRHFESNQ